MGETATVPEALDPREPDDVVADAPPPADFVAGSAVHAVDGVDGRYRAEIANDWRIFYAFGGMTLAVAARAATAAVDRPDLELLTVGAQYVRPVPIGPITLQVDTVRQGRGASQAAVELYVGDDADPSQLAMRVHTTFGAPHDPQLDWVGAHWPEARPPLECPQPPPRDPDNPFADIPFHHQTDWRPDVENFDDWTPDRPPGEALANSWTRLLHDPLVDDGGFDLLSLLLYADSIGGAFGNAIGGSDPWFVLTLNLDVRLFQRPTSPWVLQHQRGWRGADGYGTGWTELWGEDRTFLGVAMQTASMKPLTNGAPQV